MLNIIIQKYIAKNNLQYGKKWIINHKKTKLKQLQKNKIMLTKKHKQEKKTTLKHRSGRRLPNHVTEEFTKVVTIVVCCCCCFSYFVIVVWLAPQIRLPLSLPFLFVTNLGPYQKAFCCEL